MKLFDNSNFEPLIDKMLFLESQLEQLEQLPMLKVNPNNPAQQKVTPAAKLYKEFLQQYTNVLKIIMRQTGDEEEDKQSLLRSWLKMRGENI